MMVCVRVVGLRLPSSSCCGFPWPSLIALAHSARSFALTWNYATWDHFFQHQQYKTVSRTAMLLFFFVHPPADGERKILNSLPLHVFSYIPCVDLPPFRVPKSLPVLNFTTLFTHVVSPHEPHFKSPQIPPYTNLITLPRFFTHAVSSINPL